jgi:hypothetical protein
MSDETGAAETSAGHARLERVDWLSFGVTTLLALSVYLFTLAPEVSLGWSGALDVGAAYAGISPPPGYPAWTLYSWLFVRLIPFSNIAWRVAVGSAVAAALAGGLVAVTVSRGAKLLFDGTPAFLRLKPDELRMLRGVCGYVAGSALCFSSGLWGVAVVADFSAFSVLLMALILYRLLRWIETRRTRFCYEAFLYCGLLLTNSQELLIALPGIACLILFADRKLGRDVSLIVLPLAAIATLANQFSVWPLFPKEEKVALTVGADGGWWMFIWDILPWDVNFPLLAVFTGAVVFGIVAAVKTRRVGSEWKSALGAATCLLLGLAFYFYLPIASATDPPINWAYPRTFEGFTHMIGRFQHERVDPTRSPKEFPQQLWLLLSNASRDFGWPYLVAAAMSFCFVRRLSSTGRKWLFGLLAVGICTGPLLVAMLNPAPDRQSFEMLGEYLFVFHIVIAVCAGLGLVLLGTLAGKQPARQLT